MDINNLDGIDSIVNVPSSNNNDDDNDNDSDVNAFMYQTLQNESDNLIKFVYPDSNQLFQVILFDDPTKSDSDVNDFINLIKSDQSNNPDDVGDIDVDDVNHISMQTTEDVLKNLEKELQLSHQESTTLIEDHVNNISNKINDKDILCGADLNEIQFETDLNKPVDILDNFDPIIVTQYKCKHCSAMLQTLIDAQNHFITNHSSSNSLSFKPEDVLKPKETVQRKEDFSSNTNQIIKCSKKRKRVKRLTFKSGRKFPCDWHDCDYVARLKSHLVDHRRCHTGEKPFRCDWDECGQSFSQSSALKSHIRSHTGEKPYACHYPNCTISFAQKCNLTVHMRVHTGERPYRCDWPGCESAFKNNSNLDVHKRIHLGKKLFICDHPGCSQRFIQSSYLRKHKLIHSVNLSEKLLSCEWSGCTYQTNRRSDLLSHTRAHSRLFCTQCQKTFPRQISLKRHIEQVHSGCSIPNETIQTENQTPISSLVNGS